MVAQPRIHLRYHAMAASVTVPMRGFLAAGLFLGGFLGAGEKLRDIGRGKRSRSDFAEKLIVAELIEPYVAFFQVIDHAAHAAFDTVELALDILQLVQH